MSGEERADGIAGKFSPDETPRGPARNDGFLSRLNAEPILPETSASGNALIAVIAVMSFLAAIALAALVLIVSASREWTSELQSGVTVQIKGADAETIAADAAEALALLQSTEGVLLARAVSQEEAARLLEPWLGKGNVSDYLNIPALIEARVDDKLRADLDTLEAKIKAVAPGAVVDDHKAWRDRLETAARSGQALAGLVFLLIMGAAAAITAFAARASLAANAEIVSILHLVGATDAFVANEVQRRFLFLALKGSALGLILAALALGLIGFAMRASGGAAGFLPELKLGPGLLASLLLVPLALCLVTATTARRAVLTALSKEM